MAEPKSPAMQDGAAGGEGRMHGRGVRLATAVIAGAIGIASASPVVPAIADATVVVTIKPLHALVARVMAGAGSPQLLVHGALSAHTYALKPSDAAKLHQADLVFRMSDVMEPFTVKIVR